MAQPPPAFVDPQAELQYIVNRSVQLGLDPEAVLAVAVHEGGSIPGQVGDQGTSFGPWQLHAGGALPGSVWAQGPAYAKQWADSQAGIDYALQGIAAVAKGQHGPEAVRSIVYGFERPADPASETRAAVQTYQGGGKPSLGSGQGQSSGIPFQVPGLPWLHPSIPVPSVTNPLAPLQTAERAYKFLTSWRFVELVGGFLLLLIGLYLLARQFGVNATVPSPVKAAGDTVDSQASVEAAYRRGEQQGRESRARSLGRERSSRSLSDKANARRRRNTERRRVIRTDEDFGDVPY